MSIWIRPKTLIISELLGYWYWRDYTQDKYMYVPGLTLFFFFTTISRWVPEATKATKNFGFWHRRSTFQEARLLILLKVPQSMFIPAGTFILYSRVLAFIIKLEAFLATLNRKRMLLFWTLKWIKRVTSNHSLLHLHFFTKCMEIKGSYGW